MLVGQKSGKFVRNGMLFLLTMASIALGDESSAKDKAQEITNLSEDKKVGDGDEWYGVDGDENDDGERDIHWHVSVGSKRNGSAVFRENSERYDVPDCVCTVSEVGARFNLVELHPELTVWITGGGSYQNAPPRMGVVTYGPWGVYIDVICGRKINLDSWEVGIGGGPRFSIESVCLRTRSRYSRNDGLGVMFVVTRKVGPAKVGVKCRVGIDGQVVYGDNAEYHSLIPSTEGINEQDSYAAFEAARMALNQYYQGVIIKVGPKGPKYALAHANNIIDDLARQLASFPPYAWSDVVSALKLPDRFESRPQPIGETELPRQSQSGLTAVSAYEIYRLRVIKMVFEHQLKEIIHAISRAHSNVREDRSKSLENELYKVLLYFNDTMMVAFEQSRDGGVNMVLDVFRNASATLSERLSISVMFHVSVSAANLAGSV